MGNENTYRMAMQAAFEELIINAGSQIGGVALVEIFDAASRTAGWYAEHENEPHYHRTLDETRTLEQWRQYWHEMGDGTPFKYWTCMNLELASYDPPLFALTAEDAQIMAHSMGLEPLTEEQIRRVTKMLESGLDEWHEIMTIAITAAVKGERTAGDPVDTRATGA